MAQSERAAPATIGATGMKFPDGETKILADMPAKSEKNEVLEDAAL